MTLSTSTAFRRQCRNTLFKHSVSGYCVQHSKYRPALKIDHHTVFRTSHFRANLSFIFNTLFQTQVLKILVSVVRFRPWAPLLPQKQGARASHSFYFLRCTLIAQFFVCWWADLLCWTQCLDSLCEHSKWTYYWNILSRHSLPTHQLNTVFDHTNPTSSLINAIGP